MDVLYGVMDSQLLVGCVVSVVIAGLITVMMKYSFASQETAYGEHISTLYGSNSAAALKTKAARAAEKKKRAKLAKAEQSKQPTSKQVGDGSHAHHHVAIDPDPVIFGEKGPPPKPSLRKRTNSKSILHNKDEKPLVSSEVVESRLEFTQGHSPPVDEVEVRHRKQSQDNSKGNGKILDDVEYSLPNVEISEDVILPVKSANVNTESSPPPVSRPNSTPSKGSPDESVADVPKKAMGKASKTKPSNDEGDGGKKISVDDILRTVSELGADKAALEQLTEKLVTKHGAETWERKSSVKERMGQLAKQLESLQGKLDDEKGNVATANEKLQEANNKLLLAEKNQNNKLQEMQMRMQQMQDRHRAEVQGIQQARYQEIQRMQQHIQQVREENQSLRQALPNTDEVAQMRNQLRALESELNDQQLHVTKSEARCVELNTRLNSAAEAHRQENMRCAELTSRVDDITYKHSVLDKQLAESKTRAHAAENDLRNLQDHLRTKDIEIKELHTEILSAKQATTETISSTSEADNTRIQKLEETVASLKSNLAGKEGELASLQKQVVEATEELDKANIAAAQSNSPSTVTPPQGDDTAAHLHTISQLEEEVTSLESETKSLKEKIDELRKTNYTMSQSLEKAESAAGTVAGLEAELDKKSSSIHQLKAINQTLQNQTSELQEKIDQLNNAALDADDLRQELRGLRQGLEEKTDIVSGLERALSEERERVSATESECKNLLENELHRSLTSIEDRHKFRIDDLQSSLDQSEARITDLEKLLHQSESRIKQALPNAERACNGTSEVEELHQKLAKLQEEKENLLAQVSKQENSPPQSDNAEGLTVYYTAEIQRLQTNIHRLSTTDVGDILTGKSDANNNNRGGGGSVSVKLIPVSGDLETHPRVGELRRELLSTQRRFEHAKSELYSSRNQLAQSTPDADIKSMLKKLAPTVNLEPNTPIEKDLETFYKQAVSDVTPEESHSQTNEYKEALEKAAMLEDLSVTWQAKLDDKESQISSLQEKLEQANRTITLTSSSSGAQAQQATPPRAMRLASSGSLKDVSTTV